MKILGIETSCDETAVCLLEANGDFNTAQFKILGNSLYSQIAIHKEYGGVFPALAKREHSKNLVPLLGKALTEAGIVTNIENRMENEELGTRYSVLGTMLSREPELLEHLLKFLPTIEKPPIDMIAVTSGPGLEPALWVGVNFAKALSIIWNIPVYPINHMEGHILSPLIETHQLKKIAFPSIALLISGGHTELVHVKDWLEYEVIGKTRDDAVGEAFDKVARMLDLPYPGGPEISKLAEQAKPNPEIKFPRPMLNSPDLDFSFSGLKTSVLYFIQKQPELTFELKCQIAKEFEDTVIEVLVTKTRKALEQYPAKNIILGGGVIANKKIRKAFEELVQEINLLVPPLQLSTDNAIMIAVAGYFNFLVGKQSQDSFGANGNLSL